MIIILKGSTAEEREALAKKAKEKPQGRGFV